MFGQIQTVKKVTSTFIFPPMVNVLEFDVNWDGRDGLPVKRSRVRIQNKIPEINNIAFKLDVNFFNQSKKSGVG